MSVDVRPESFRAPKHVVSQLCDLTQSIFEKEQFSSSLLTSQKITSW